jgi:beta-N-acetylhexosaminidase
MSSAVMTDLLRDELGYDGLIVTDAMEMRAIADKHGVAAASARAIIAGADAAMPLIEQSGSLAALEAALTGGRLSQARLAAALHRADQLELRLRDRADPRARIPDSDHAALALDVARRSLTLHASHGLLPLAAGSSVAVISFPTRRPSPIEEVSADVDRASVAGALERAGLRVHEVQVSGTSEGFAADREAALRAAAVTELVICATRDAYLWEDDRRLVAELAAGGWPSILVALRSPYDLAVLADTDERIATYADVPATLQALGEALTGRAGFPGRLPLRMNLSAEAA